MIILKKEYYNLKKEELFRLYNTSSDDLSSSEVNNRIKKCGLNVLPLKNTFKVLSKYILTYLYFFYLVCTLKVL